jgi:UDP-N-acetylmuramyl pentapeptide phosphotransferase/UDP-N-acetylglucosamine-1-phosphate transferase
MTSLVTAFLVGFVAAGVATPVVRFLAVRARLLDIPNERSSHSVPTPRTGGLAIIFGAGVGLAAATTRLDSQLGFLLAIAAAMAVVSEIDDVRGLSRSVRLIAQASAAVILIRAAGLSFSPVDLPIATRGLGILAGVVTLVWIVGVTNAYNFMDGINGIAAAQAVIAATTLAVLAHRHGDLAAAAVLLAIAGACAGFLPWNFPGGSIFMGDVGSVTVGFALAGLIVRLSLTSVSSVAAALTLAPFLLDTTATLTRRIWRGEPFLSAHRSHFYQRQVALGYSHATVTATWSLLAVVSALAAVGYDGAGPAARVVLLAAVFLAHIIVAGLIVRSENVAAHFTRRTDQ